MNFLKNFFVAALRHLWLNKTQAMVKSDLFYHFLLYTQLTFAFKTATIQLNGEISAVYLPV